MFLSCSENKLKRTLKSAGPNRSELDAVLEHYQDDPEKLAAASFLIENMFHWYGYAGWQLDSLLSVMAEGTKERYISKETIEEWRDISGYSAYKVSDSKTINAQYLIENIDLAFRVYKERPWNKHLPFEEFCELILPYRIYDEALSPWRKKYYEYYSHLLDSLCPGGTDVVEACNIIASDLKKKGYYYFTAFSTPHLGGDFLFDYRIGSCRETCDMAVYAMRACGIPVAIDEFVYSPEYQYGHTWCVVRDTTGRFLPFSFDAFLARRDMKDDGRKKGKVYRSYYGIQEESFDDIRNNQKVPFLFKDHFKKDVTANYLKSNNIVVPIQKEGKEEFVYLGVFSPRGWIPVDIARRQGKTAVFRNVEPDIIYQPLYSNGETHRPAGYPFVCLGDSIRLLKPLKDETEDVDLYRKMSLIKNYRMFLYNNIIGARIEGSRDSTFKDPELLYEFEDTLRTNYYEIPVSTSNKYNYVRYVSPRGKHIELAELAFYEDSLLQEPIELIRINNVPSRSKDSYYQAITDGDILSFFWAIDTSQYIAYKTEKECIIKRIRFSPRNDDNFIWPGDEYELFYQDGVKGWVSLGCQVASNERVLHYEVPANALFWLRNLTKGQEEQVFYIENGKQIFTFDI